MNNSEFIKNLSTITNNLLRKIETKDWGFSIPADSELDALRIAYLYRNAPDGCKVEPTQTGWQVTVWNGKAKEMGCDC